MIFVEMPKVGSILKFAAAGLVAALSLSLVAPAINGYTKNPLITALILIGLGVVGMKFGGVWGKYIGGGLIVAGVLNLALTYVVPAVSGVVNRLPAGN